MKENEHLPVTGVGPIYVAIIILLTVLGICLRENSVIKSGTVIKLKIPFIIIGVILIIVGVIIFIRAQIDIGDNIVKNKLVTKGVYKFVRNPIYSAFMITCTGALLCAHNLWLLILPFVFWLFMTVLMINTEEKWLTKLYGKDYIEYCKNVNRCIPGVRRHI